MNVPACNINGYMLVELSYNNEFGHFLKKSVKKGNLFELYYS